MVNLQKYALLVPILLIQSRIIKTLFSLFLSISSSKSNPLISRPFHFTHDLERKMKIMTELKRRPIGSSKTKFEDVKKIKIMSSCGNRTAESNIIDFPNSLHGVKRYASNMKCTWTIFWDYDYVIKFKRFDLEESENCEYDYFRVADGEKLCGRNILPNDVYVDNTVGKVRLMFRSDGYTNGEGFKVQILKMEKGRGNSNNSDCKARFIVLAEFFCYSG